MPDCVVHWPDAGSPTDGSGPHAPVNRQCANFQSGGGLNFLTPCPTIRKVSFGSLPIALRQRVGLGSLAAHSPEAMPSLIWMATAGR